MVAVFVLAVPFDTYLPLFGYPVLPAAILLSPLFIAGCWYAITRYRLMTLNFHTAADHILQKMIDPVLLVDEKLMIREVNAGVQVLTGWNESELLGKSLSQLINEGSEKNRKIGQSAEFTSGSKIEVLLKTRSGGPEIPCMLSSRIFRDDSSDMLGHIVMLHDISELKRYEQLLLQTNDELENKVSSAH